MITGSPVSRSVVPCVPPLPSYSSTCSRTHREARQCTSWLPPPSFLPRLRCSASAFSASSCKLHAKSTRLGGPSVDICNVVYYPNLSWLSATADRHVPLGDSGCNDGLWGSPEASPCVAAMPVPSTHNVRQSCVLSVPVPQRFVQRTPRPLESIFQIDQVPTLATASDSSSPETSPITSGGREFVGLHYPLHVSGVNHSGDCTGRNARPECRIALEARTMPLTGSQDACVMSRQDLGQIVSHECHLAMATCQPVPSIPQIRPLGQSK